MHYKERLQMETYEYYQLHNSNIINIQNINNQTDFCLKL